jgi:hypothetical protein
MIILTLSLLTLNYSTTTLLIPGLFARIFFAMSRNGISNIDTLKRSRIKGAAEYMDAKGIPYSHNDLFKFHDVSKEQGWAILKQDSWTADRRYEHSELTTENRGKKPFLSHS